MQKATQALQPLAVNRKAGTTESETEEPGGAAAAFELNKEYT